MPRKCVMGHIVLPCCLSLLLTCPTIAQDTNQGPVITDDLSATGKDRSERYAYVQTGTIPWLPPVTIPVCWVAGGFDAEKGSLLLLFNKRGSATAKSPSMGFSSVRLQTADSCGCSSISLPMRASAS